jgi:hypothetical protein
MKICRSAPNRLHPFTPAQPLPFKPIDRGGVPPRRSPALGKRLSVPWHMAHSHGTEAARAAEISRRRRRIFLKPMVRRPWWSRRPPWAAAGWWRDTAERGSVEPDGAGALDAARRDARRRTHGRPGNPSFIAGSRSGKSLPTFGGDFQAARQGAHVARQSLSSRRASRRRTRQTATHPFRGVACRAARSPHPEKR